MFDVYLICPSHFIVQQNVNTLEQTDEISAELDL